MKRLLIILTLAILCVGCASTQNSPYNPGPPVGGATDKAPEQTSDATTEQTSVETPDPTLAEADDDLLADLMDEFDDETVIRPDPLKPWNVVWFHFNDKLYFWLLKPIGKTYGFILYPEPVRLGVRNVIDNVGFPGRFFNCLLQGRLKDSGTEVGRFGVNTTLGIVGLFRVSDKFGWEEYEEDFGQTLGVWGFDPGWFVTWPLLGPCTARDTFGLLGNAVLNPIQSFSYVRALNLVNDISIDEYPYESILDLAVDPYSSVRDAYFQNRQDAVEK